MSRGYVYGSRVSAIRNQVFVTALGVGGVVGGTSGLVASRTCTNGSTARHHDGKCRDYIHTFSVCTDGTVGNGKAHTAISDGVEGLLAGSSGLGRPVWYPRTES